MSAWAEFVRKKYLGQVIVMQNMASDPAPIKKGTKGVVEDVDGLGDLVVAWEDGRTLKVLINVDSFDIVK